MADADRGKKTREDILNAGARLFALHGYFNTSTNDILEAVSISKGAFYYHFKSKEALALAVLERLRSQYQQFLIDPVEAQAQPPDRLMAMLAKLVDLHDSPRWDNFLLLARLTVDMTHQEGELSERLAQTMEWLIDYWEELIIDAQAADNVRADLDPRILAELIMAVLLGQLGCGQMQGRSTNLEKTTDLIQRLIRN